MDLKSLYYSPKTGLSSLNSFYQRAKALYPDVARTEVSKFLAQQELTQRNKDHVERHYFPIRGQEKSYQADLLDMGVREYKGYRYILNIINVNTRKAFAFALKKKSDTPDVLISWLKESKPSVIQVDQGTEFTNNKVKKYCESHDVNLRLIDPVFKTDQGKVERFNGTLRRLITLYLMSYRTNDWVSALPNLLENYNSRWVQRLGTSPDKATEHSGDSKNVRQFEEAQRYFDSFGFGDRVRHLIRRKNLFTKGRNAWSKEVYTIDGIQFHQFHLKGYGWVKSWEVQLVPDETESFEPPEPEEKAVPLEVLQKRAKSKRSLRKEGLKSHLTPGTAEVPQAEKREAKAPEAFVAEPAPPQQTLDRSHLKPKRQNAPRKGIDPDSIKFTQSRLDSRKFHYGVVTKVGAKYESRYDTGQVVSYTPAELIPLRFPLTKADQLNLPKVRKLLGV